MPAEAEARKPVRAKVLAPFGARDESLPAATADAFEAGLGLVSFFVLN